MDAKVASPQDYEVVEQYTKRAGKNVLYQPTRQNVVPFMLWVFTSFVCITISVCGYYLVIADVRNKQQRDFAAMTAPANLALQISLNDTKATVQRAASIMSITAGNMTQKQFITFTHPNGAFPANLQRMYYISYVQPNNVDTFIQRERMLGGNYSTFNITSRIKGVVAPYIPGQDEYFPVTRYSPSEGVALLGFDHYSSTLR